MCLAFAKEPFEIKSGACGTVVRNAEMKVVDPDTSVSLPRNQLGEMCIRGNQIMKGYLNDPESTERTIDKMLPAVFLQQSPLLLLFLVLGVVVHFLLYQRKIKKLCPRLHLLNLTMLLLNLKLPMRMQLDIPEYQLLFFSH